MSSVGTTELPLDGGSYIPLLPEGSWSRKPTLTAKSPSPLRGGVRGGGLGTLATCFAPVVRNDHDRQRGVHNELAAHAAQQQLCEAAGAAAADDEQGLTHVSQYAKLGGDGGGSLRVISKRALMDFWAGIRKPSIR